MSQVEDFLTKEEEFAIIEAIQQAEKSTSGEIRVHIEARSVSAENKAPIDAFERAKEVFELLKMSKTRERNGVLLYIAVQDRTLVIMGDEGINEVVEKDFWESTKNVIIKHFKRGEMKDGLVNGILRAGEKLKKHFPYQQDDKNELSDDISFG
ncbi:MAG TPA: TPM domain-containing protein [Flavobacteriaceae bacterium]|nr:TPM domain-containing protein [Flavobacteriaceae bacterium]